MREWMQTALRSTFGALDVPDDRRSELLAVASSNNSPWALIRKRSSARHPQAEMIPYRVVEESRAA
jgi:hypothetical protein